MSKTSTLAFSGTTKYAKVRKPDEKYEHYDVPMYLDEESWERFDKSGIQLEVKTDEDGKFVRFKRKVKEWDGTENAAPEVFLKDDQSGDYIKWPNGLIGNGSTITVTVDSWSGRNGVAHRLQRVFIDKLVPYEPAPKVTPDSAKLPF